MKKVVLVKTDDPQKRKFNLVVTGQVEKVADINPASVYMNGKPGDTLEAVVNITPSEKYKFSILGMKQKINTRIKATLIEPVKGKKTWQIKIKSTSDKAKDLYDVLTLKTDSKYKPELTIRVYAIFLGK
ncbi:MAG: hypothetical protein GXP56_16150 [Deltaproteobacteria bacterium]|nr:hypothetical protein [Deltaproteobacteria bacterium]